MDILEKTGWFLIMGQTAQSSPVVGPPSASCKAYF